jgi:predicted nucleic acid-binding protein
MALNATLLDSDVLIEILRQRDLVIVERWRALADSETVLLCSPVTVAEIWTGVRSGEENLVEAAFRAMTCVLIDEEIGRRAGEYLRTYRRSHGLSLGDALLAATAASHGVPLWTRNRKHYPMRDLQFV